ncbi:hypothetical protein IOC57_24725 [Bacillus sp. SD075]|uniref:hypothetical protein n=1 Tax=Bacillus sp. SD075 TaxID=2781732 RepID=UPI001A971033|nr:hypothetical protein [Bacillus sp. SD075]MBO1000918.1 hypothetical protein [Bacillus sp. SD075]
MIILKNGKNKSSKMNEAYEFAKRNDINLIELDYWVENIAAKEFYKKHLKNIGSLHLDGCKSFECQFSKVEGINKNPESGFFKLIS